MIRGRCDGDVTLCSAVCFKRLARPSHHSPDTTPPRKTFTRLSPILSFSIDLIGEKIPIAGSSVRFKRRFERGRGDADPSETQQPWMDGFLAGRDVRIVSRWRIQHWRNGLNRRRSPSACLADVRREEGTVAWNVYVDVGTQACEASNASCIRIARLSVVPSQSCGIVLPSVHNDVSALVTPAKAHRHDAFCMLFAPHVNLSTTEGCCLEFESNQALVGCLEPGSKPTFDRTGFPFEGDLIGNSSRLCVPFGRPRKERNPASSRASESRVAIFLDERTPWRTRCVRKGRETVDGRGRIGTNEA